MITSPNPLAARDLSVTATTRKPLALSDSTTGQRRGSADESPLGDGAASRHAPALPSLAPSDWAFITASTATPDPRQSAVSALASRIAAERDSGALPPGHPIDLEDLQRLSRATHRDSSGQVQPLLTAQQHAAAQRYLDELGGRASIDFRA